MIISLNTNSSVLTQAQNNMAKSLVFQQNQNNFTNKFDELVTNINGSISEQISKANASLFEELSKITDDEKQTYAYGAYSEMQNICDYAITRNEQGIEEYNELEDEKSYYQSLLSDDKVYFDEKKYVFEDTEAETAFKNQIKALISECGDSLDNVLDSSKEIIDREEVKAALADVQQRINNLVTYGDLTSKNTLETFGDNDLYKKLYTVYACMFMAVAPETAVKYQSLLNVDNDTTLNVCWNRTEENFIEKANDDIQALENRSKGLYDMIHDYANDQNITVEELKISAVGKGFVSNADYTSLDTLEQSWNVFNSMNNSLQRNKSNLESNQDELEELDIYV